MKCLHKLKWLLLFILLCQTNVQANTLTESSEISVLTYEPGNEVYTIFGHTALRVRDTALQFDQVYNFGTFEFSSLYFYVDFFSGKLDYYLTIIDYKTFLHQSNREQRTVYEQILNLSIEERSVIWNKLHQTYHSDDRYYKYNFFYDNCATRIRDVIENPESISLKYDTSNYCCTTFRDLLTPYISKNYWINLSVNMGLGKEADRIANSSDFMFLPDYIYQIFEDSELTHDSKLIIQHTYSKRDYSLIILCIVLLILITIIILPKTHRFTFYLLNILFAAIGIFLFSISLFSENTAFNKNFNVLWTLPTLFVLLTKAKSRKIIEIVYLIWLLLILIFRHNLYAGFSWTFAPWIALLSICCFVNLKRQ